MNNTLFSILRFLFKSFGNLFESLWDVHERHKRGSLEGYLTPVTGTVFVHFQGFSESFDFQKKTYQSSVL